jgi:hypothetical protein
VMKAARRIHGAFEADACATDVMGASVSLFCERCLTALRHYNAAGYDAS